jgi:hypothetical protein
LRATSTTSWELTPLIVLAERVAFHGRSKAALGTQGKVFERHVSRCFVDPAPYFVLALDLRELGAYEAEDDGFAAGHEAERLEAAGAVAIVFEREGVDVQAAEELSATGS